MKIENLKEFVQRKPFKQFIIVTASSDSYRVISPEAISFSRDGDVVVYPPDGGLVLLDVDHVTAAAYPAKKRSKGAGEDAD
jgi:hypothetical protein